MNTELLHHISAYTRAIFYVTDEEDRFINELREVLKQHQAQTWVYNGAFGLQPIADIQADWENLSHNVSNVPTIHDALVKMYKDNPKGKENFYVITDPDRWFKDELVHRRVLNLIHQGHQNKFVVKVMIFVGPRRSIPEKLQRYFTVIQDTGLNTSQTKDLVSKVSEMIRAKVPPNEAQLFRGMTSYEVEESITLSAYHTRKSAEGRQIDPTFIQAYKRNQLRKTDLVQYVETTKDSFDKIGGADRFKSWARKTKACWTEAGQAFGLRPPRGVLLVGVYGCGKSISAKAMANEWDLPLVQFEMGKLRSSGVGDSEANLYRALRIVESVAPCVLWIDEAEKSLAGSQSSAQSDAGTTSRLLGILSTWTQESKAPICIVMTANSLKSLPVEMVNRMPQRFFFDLPNEEDRIDILKIHGAAAGQDLSTFNLVDLAEKAKSLVGREIEQAIQEAMVESYTKGKPGLDEDILATELAHRPRIIKTMTDEIQEVLAWVGYDPEVDDGIRARLASSHRSEQFNVTLGGTP